MRYERTTLNELVKKTIDIGYVGEQNHTRIVFSCYSLFEQYPNAVATMIVKPPSGDNYPVVVERDQSTVVWYISTSDVAKAGTGQYQLTFTNDNEIIKQAIGSFSVKPSLVGSGEAPAPVDDWIADANEVLVEVQAAVGNKIDNPSTPGTDGQVLTSDGSGGVEWRDPTGGGGGGGTSNYNDLSNKPKINNVTLSGNKTLASLGIVTVDDTAGSGATAKTWSADKLAGLEQRVADLEYVPVQINSLSVSPNMVEIGSTRTTATLTYSMNRDATQMKLDGNVIQNTSASGTISLTGLSLTASKTWTLQATDERMSQQSEWVSKTVTMTFTNKVEYGVAAAPATLNDTFLNSLPTRTLSTGKIRSFSVTAGSGQYIWYALPSSYGTCTFTVGGFTGGFSLVATQNHTNESGATVEYRIYRSDNANLGSVSVTVA